MQVIIWPSVAPNYIVNMASREPSQVRQFLSFLFTRDRVSLSFSFLNLPYYSINKIRFYYYGMTSNHSFIVEDGQWNHSAVEMCCPTCRMRRTPIFTPCFKFETTCTLVDFKCVIPCDRDQPLEIGVCGWNCYTKREKVNTNEERIA